MRLVLVGCAAVLAAGSAAAQFKFSAEQREGAVPHPRMVTDLVFSPDGKNLVTLEGKEGPPVPGGRGPVSPPLNRTTVRFWDIGAKQVLQTSELEGRMTDDVVAYAPDGRSVAVKLGGEVPPDGRSVAGKSPADLGLVDGKTGKVLATLKAVLSSCLKLVYVPDGQTLYAYESGVQVQPFGLKSLDAPRVLVKFRSPGYLFPETYLTADGGRWLVKNPDYPGWTLYDRAALKPVAAFPAAELARLSADGKTAVLVNPQSGQFVIIDPATGRERGFVAWPATSKFPEATPPYPKRFAVAPDGRRLAYVEGSRNVVVAELDAAAVGKTDAAGQVVKLPAPYGKPGAVRNAVFSQDEGTAVVFGGEGVPASVFDGKTFQRRVVLADPANPKDQLTRVHYGVVSADGGTGVFVADVWGPRAPGERNRLLSADLKTGRTKLLDARNEYLYLAGSADGNHLVTVVQEPGAMYQKIVFQSAGGKPVTLSDKGWLASPALAVSDDGKWACGEVRGPNNDLQVRVWDTATGEAGGVAGVSGPTAVAFLPDNKTIAFVVRGPEAPSRDVAFVAAATGQLTASLKDFDKRAGQYAYLAVSPAGGHIASYNANAEVFLHAAPSGDLLARLSGHTGPIYQAKFTPSGKRLVTFSNDGDVRVWDVPAK